MFENNVTLVFGQMELLDAVSVVFSVSKPTVVQADPRHPTLLALTQYWMGSCTAVGIWETVFTVGEGLVILAVAGPTAGMAEKV